MNSENKISIISHRGIDLGEVSITEGTLGAFSYQLSKGFGIEFDVRLSKDEQIVIAHDPDVARITSGKDLRSINEITTEELIHTFAIPSLAQIVSLISQYQSSTVISALHIKSEFQYPEFLDLLLSEIEEIDAHTYIIFDLKPQAAEYIKSKNPKLVLAASVAHPYDRERYNGEVGATLSSLEEALQNLHLFEWVWLDEWDRLDEGGRTKTFYNEEIISRARQNGLKIAAVTPELHKSFKGTPAHSDAQSQQALFKRFEEIVNLRPDALCTDFPGILRDILKKAA